MLKFAVKEDNGYTFVSTNVKKLYAYLKNRLSGCRVNQTIAMEFAFYVSPAYENFFANYPLEITPDFENFFTSKKVGEKEFIGKIYFGANDQSQYLNHFEYLDDFMNHLVESVIFTFSPIICEKLKNKEILFKFNDTCYKNSSWTFSLVSGLTGEILFNSNESGGDPLKLHHDFFMAMTLYNVITEHPTVLNAEHYTDSGHFDK